ncbi:MAG: hypothetical protein EOP47_28295, partial [Sphingobacteriaceae bacterium]
AIVYVTDLSGTTNAATANVLKAGHYSFDGTRWNNMLVPKLTGFSAKKIDTYNITSAGTFDVVYAVVEYDTNSWYNPAEGKFTPKVPGYYQFTAGLRMQDGGTTERRISLYKNTDLQFAGTSMIGAQAIVNVVNGMVYLNGTTDFVVVKLVATGAINVTSNSAALNQSYFQGYLVGQ